MKINIISLFPDFFEAFAAHSIIRRAIEANRLTLQVINPRDFSHNKHGHIDDTPYGGGAGMLMKAPPLFEAVESIPIPSEAKKKIIFLGPAGVPFTQDKAKELATYDQLIFICGHYEGVDYRVETALAEETISLGDYVLTGGELPAMVVIDAVARMLPGVLGAPAGAEEDSFYKPLLECPQYTKPPEYRGMKVPDILLSGHHKNIAQWRLQKSIARTWKYRPDLLQRELTEEEQRILVELHKNQDSDI